MEIDQIRYALRQASPGIALRSAVQQFANAGHSREEIVSFLESFLGELRSQDGNNHIAEDALLEILDALNGWCHPAARLLSDKPV